MSIGGRIFAATYDHQMRKVEKAGFRARREALLAGAHGDVLEIGAGTGANLAFYSPAVESLTLTDPEAPMMRRLDRNARASSPLIKVLRAPAEDLPFNDGVFDVAVSTLVLCTVTDQARALREVRRVLKPGGTLLFLEHVRSHDPRRARTQDRVNVLSRIVAHGCNCNRSTLEGIKQAGFTVTNIEHGELPKAPVFLRPLIAGRATAPVHVHL